MSGRCCTPGRASVPYRPCGTGLTPHRHSRPSSRRRPLTARRSTQRRSTPRRPERGGLRERRPAAAAPTDYKSHGALRRWPRGTPGAVLGARPPPIRRQPRRRAVRQCVAPHRAVKRESAPFRRLSPPRFAAAPCGSGGWRLCPGGRRPETERARRGGK